MAKVTVSVEDAVAGALPPVCVKTGRAADRVVRFRTTSGRVRTSQVVALLVLGPLGLLVAERGGTVVLLPLSADAATAMRDRRRARAFGVGGAVLLLVGTLLAAFVNLVALLFLFAVLVVVALQWRADRSGVGVVLDPSRRWVALSGVHPAFVAAVEAGPRSAR